MVDIPPSKLTAAGALTGEEIVMISQLSTSVTKSAATISALAADNSFNDSGSGFVTAGFAVNDYVHVTGFTGNVANNIFSGKITALTAGKMTIGGTDGDVIVDDAAGETVIITKWVSRRSPLSSSASARVLIAETVTSGSATNVSFASIPTTYRDLEVRVRGRGTTAAAQVAIRMRFNSDSAANYDFTEHDLVNGTTSGAPAVAQTFGLVGVIAAASATADYADLAMAMIADYRGTTFQKSGHWSSATRTGTTTATLTLSQGGNWWRSKVAISQIDVFPAAGGFVNGSIVSLYGLL